MYDSCVVAGQLHNVLNDLKRWWCMKANSIVVFHWVLNCGDYNVSAVCEQTGCLLCLGSGWLKCLSLLGAEELLCCSALLPCGSSQHPASADPTVAPGDEVRAPCATYTKWLSQKKHTVCLRSHPHLMLSYFGAASFRAFIALFCLCSKWNNFGKSLGNNLKFFGTWCTWFPNSLKTY